MIERADKGGRLRWRDRGMPLSAITAWGRVESAALGLDGFTVEGWTRAWTEDPAPPTILLARDGVVRAEWKAGALKDGRHSFAETLPLQVVGAPLVFDFRLYAVSPAGEAVRLEATEQAGAVLGLALRSVHDFYRKIQTPSTRISDPELLLHVAIYAFQRFPDDYPLNAGALCVLGYRILEATEANAALLAIFDTQKARLIEQAPTLPKGLFLRWHTSIRLIAGYLAYQRGLMEEAIGHFEAIARFADELPDWPTAMTNVLLGGFIAGYLHWERGDRDRAIACWDQAPAIFRLGAGQAPFQNFYAYGEVANAIRVAQESFVARKVAETGGPIADPAIGPVGRGIQLEQLPSPIGRLVAQRRGSG
ncbi:hypothetical protein [Roseicella aquatilis]|uniref:Tetratricopeptide repeat protein n=1 Tax=Roseicella aquatilis TaxID=2527868 RepID=A0A4R4DB10_9PROT|nr:hypothetical protein [Roseicella aquatilis]TCZ56597.1 hypothetical protein EXY23_19585 [Roseicella aquatilis]